MSNNPLLGGEGLPPFDLIQVSMVEPAIATLLAELTSQLQTLEAQLTAQPFPTWQDLVPPLEQIGDRLSWTWGIISHLQGVKNSPELRQAYQAVQPQVIEFYNRLGQSQPIYQAAKHLRTSTAWTELSPGQQRWLEAAIRDAELAGVGLTEPARSQFNQLKMELADLSTQFANHVLDATKQFYLDLTEPEQLTGLPPSYLAQVAQADSHTWRITLDYPSYVPFMQHSQRRDLREQLYRTFITRASAGELDNNPVLTQILKLRQTQAQLLGYANYAELSLASKMAPNVTAIEVLIEELRQASYGAAIADLENLQAFAQSQGFEGDLCHWDISFWAERLREAQFDLNEEALRPYFPLPQVLAGLFGLVERLFGVTVVAADGEAPVWHEDVRYFRIQDQQQDIAYFYLDPYSRPAEKRGGAWMDICLGRSRLGEKLRLPVAYLICNQTPPLAEQPSLMTFREVETLFHEFGHGLQHMLTEVDLGGVAGINNVEWDAVELASQFMENWCYDRETLFGMAKHYQTGEPLPEAEYQKLLAAKNFMSGSAMLRQLFLSQLDLDLHKQIEVNPHQVRSHLAQTMSVIPPLPEDQMLCSFGHIFAGGYAAGYYSYKWAEVLSADAFAAFEEVGLEDPAAIATLGRRYRQTILAKGGSEHPMQVFAQFRGRAPKTEPLLRHSGLLVSPQA